MNATCTSVRRCIAGGNGEHNISQQLTDYRRSYFCSSASRRIIGKSQPDHTGTTFASRISPDKGFARERDENLPTVRHHRPEQYECLPSSLPNLNESELDDVSILIFSLVLINVSIIRD